MLFQVHISKPPYNPPISPRKDPDMLARAVFHTFMTVLTGGLWLVYLIVRFLLTNSR